MKLNAYIPPVLYKQYCRVNWVEDSEESLRRFLREVGTHSVTFQDGSGADYRNVPLGTCIRLHTSDKYGILSTRYLNLYTTLYSNVEPPKVEVRTPVESRVFTPSCWCFWK